MYSKNIVIRFIIVFNLLATIAINPIINAHENHDHQIYSWSNSKNKTIKTDSTFNSEKLKDKKIREKLMIEVVKIFEDKSKA